MMSMESLVCSFSPKGPCWGQAEIGIDDFYPRIENWKLPSSVLFLMVPRLLKFPTHLWIVLRAWRVFWYEFGTFLLIAVMDCSPKSQATYSTLS